MFNETNENCMSISNITSLGRLEKDEPSKEDASVPETAKDEEITPSIEESSTITITNEEVSKSIETSPKPDEVVETLSTSKNLASIESPIVDSEMKSLETSSSDIKVEENIIALDDDKEMPTIKQKPSEDTSKVFKDVMDGVQKLLQSKFFASEQEKKKLEEFEKTFLDLQTSISEKEKVNLMTGLFVVFF